MGSDADHIDKDYAAKHHGGLTAPGTYLLAVKLKLVHSLPLRRTVIASAGYDQVRFHRPVRAGESVSLELEWTAKRRSKSKARQRHCQRTNLLIDAGGRGRALSLKTRCHAAAGPSG